MMPGGHLATSVALGAVAYASTGSVEAAAGCFTGGFLIDFDHYLDYIVFEKQWRQPGPVPFLRYYFTDSLKRVVLPLHSIELMSVMLMWIVFHPWPLLVGYWVGALMHLVLDVLVNGDYALKRPLLFYFFTYRAMNGFAANLLLEGKPDADAGDRPVRDFFRWFPLATRREVSADRKLEGQDSLPISVVRSPGGS